jgi:hypothetical protein
MVGVRRGRPSAAPGPSAVEWVARRVRSVADGVLVRGDVPLAVVRIEPAPVALLSEREVARRVEDMREALAGLQGPWQAVSVQRPVDLDAYLADLDAALAQAAGPRRGLMREYARYVRGLVGGGEAVEVRHYLLVGPPGATWSEAEARKAAEEAAEAVRRGGLGAAVPGVGELMDLLAAALQPARRAEPVTAPAPVPMWGGVAG